MTYNIDDYYIPLTEKTRPSQEAIDKQLQNMLFNANSVDYNNVIGIDLTISAEGRDRTVYVVYDEYGDGKDFYSTHHKFSIWLWLKHFFFKPKFSKKSLEKYVRGN